MEKIEILCLKYIVDKVESESDLLSFCVFLFGILSGEGLNIEQMGTEYLSKVPLMNKNGVNMLTMNDTVMDAESLMERASMEDTVKNEPCHKYCKKKLGDNGSDICTICPRYGQTYRNDFAQEEYALIKYAATSPQNMMVLCNMIDRSKCIYRVSVDVVADIDYPDPVVVPITSTFFYQLKGSKSFYDRDTIGERLRHEVAETHFWSRIYKLNPTAKNILTANDKLREVVYGTFVANVLGAKDINEDEASDIIDRIVKAHGAGRGKAAKTAAKTKEKQLDVLSMVQQAAQKEEEKKSEEPAVETEPAPETGQSTEEKETLEETVQTVQTEEAETAEPAAEKSETSEEPVPENETGEQGPEPATPENTEPVKTEVAETDNEPTEAVETAEPMDASVPTEDEQQTEEEKPEEQQQEYTPTDDLKKGLLYMPEVTKAFLGTIQRVEENEQMYVEYIARDSWLAAETISCDNGMYLLLYISGMKRYVYADAEHMPNTIKAIMTERRIEKVTWQPYSIYSLARQNRISAKRISSILDIYFEGKTGQKCTGYKEMMNSYIKTVVPETGMRTGSRLADEYTKYMPFYGKVYREIYRQIPGGKIDEKKAVEREILGESFLRSRNFEEHTTLFEMDECGRYDYNSTIGAEVRQEGNLMSYGINSGRMENKEKKKIYKRLIYALYMKGYFRKFNLQIARIGKDSITLYCEDYIYDAIKTNIRMFFDKEAQKVENGFEHVAEHRHLIPTGTDGEIIEKQYPRSMAKAQDMLTTTHDTIKVKETRIKIEKKPAHKKQKETFPEKK